MNEALNLSRKFPSQNSVQIQKLELNDADLVNMKDMKIYLVFVYKRIDSDEK